MNYDEIMMKITMKYNENMMKIMIKFVDDLATTENVYSIENSYYTEVA